MQRISAGHWRSPPSAGLLLIAVFIFKEGLPFIFKVGLRRISCSPPTGIRRRASSASIPMIVASLWVTLGRHAHRRAAGRRRRGLPDEFVPRPVMRVVKPTIELLAGIPSVVFGFIGVMVLAPLIRDALSAAPGLSVLAASVILGIMILPTVISISIDAISAVPELLPRRLARAGRHPLADASTWWCSRRPARASSPASSWAWAAPSARPWPSSWSPATPSRCPHSALDSVRTLTANIALEMGYATGLHRQALFATGVVLFVVIMILNSLADAVPCKRGRCARDENPSPHTRRCGRRGPLGGATLLTLVDPGVHHRLRPGQGPAGGEPGVPVRRTRRTWGRAGGIFPTIVGTDPAAAAGHRDRRSRWAWARPSI